MQEKQLVIARFADPIDAHLAKGLLDAEGVPCYIMAEHAVGSVMLCVPESHVERASEIVNAHWEERGNAGICNQ